MSQAERVYSRIGRRLSALSLRPQTDPRSTNRTPPWSAV